MATTEFSDDITSTAISRDLGTDPETKPSRARKILHRLGWTALFLTFLLIFTLLKLPEARLKNYVQGTINQALAPSGMSYTAEESSLSLGLGVSYVLKNVVLTAPSGDSYKIERVEVSPSIFQLLVAAITRKNAVAGKLWIKNGDGTLKSDFAMSQAERANEASLSFRTKDLDLGKLGILPIAAGFKGSAVTTGEGSFSGDMNAPNTWNGKIDMTLSKIVVDAQSVQGFSIPSLAISEGRIEATADAGKAAIKTLRLGRAGSADDLIANVTGNATLGKRMDSSTMNIQTKFSFSDKVMKSMVLLGALLSGGKQADGSFAYNFTGPMTAPAFAPAGSPVGGAAPAPGG